MTPSRHRAGFAALIVGLLVILGARLVPGLGGPPLYDGVVPVGPYLWLTPAPGQKGGAQGAKATVAVISGQNDIVALATPESLPQAQVLAVPGALILPPGAKSLSVSITPVPPTAQPTDGTLNSNVYRFEIVDQTGAVVTARASGKVSIVLRSADASLFDGVVERFDGSAWVPLKTEPPGVGGAYLVVVTVFGDYAVVRPGSPPGSSAASGVAGSAAASAPAASGATGPTAPNGSVSSASMAPSATPSPSPGAAASSQGAGPPLLIGGIVAISVLVVVVVLARRRSGPPPARKVYRGAHRVERDDADD